MTGFPLLYYKKGVFDGCKQSDKVDHAVLLVGYKAGKGWKFKNSWGIRWGQDGYGWLKDGNTCKICQNGMYPIPTRQFGFTEFESNNLLMTCPSP